MDNEKNGKGPEKLEKSEKFSREYPTCLKYACVHNRDGECQKQTPHIIVKGTRAVRCLDFEERKGQKEGKE